MLVLLYIGTGLSIIESSSKSERKPRVGRWGGVGIVCGGISGGGAGGCGGGGCGGGGGC